MAFPYAIVSPCPLNKWTGNLSMLLLSAPAGVLFIKINGTLPFVILPFYPFSLQQQQLYFVFRCHLHHGGYVPTVCFLLQINLLYLFTSFCDTPSAFRVPMWAFISFFRLNICIVLGTKCVAQCAYDHTLFTNTNPPRWCFLPSNVTVPISCSCGTHGSVQGMGVVLVLNGFFHRFSVALQFLHFWFYRVLCVFFYYIWEMLTNI